jgi:tetrathionate reductase subunit B
MKAFVIDVGGCVGCYACQFVCKDEHVGNDWSPIAGPQPDTGQFWMRLDEHIRGSVPKVEMHYLPYLCMHCDEPPCVPACPVDGAIYKRDDGLVIIDSVKCTGCKACVDACPYGAVYFNEDLNLAQKCTGCAHLIDGEWETTRCVDACPTEAIRFGEEEDLADDIARAEVLEPELGTKPRVYYLNIPKRFVAGTVYDPVEREVVIGATCTLAGANGTATSESVVTDAFGDFWFRGLHEGSYTLTIEADGFRTQTLPDIGTEKDVNLGDIALSR